MKNKNADIVRLRHILDAINEIEAYVDGSTLYDFELNSMMKFATIKQLEIIGEAANRISNSLQEANPVIEWHKIIGLRNFLVHEYFGVDEFIIWQIIESDIPLLKEKIEEILRLLTN